MTTFLPPGGWLKGAYYGSVLRVELYFRLAKGGNAYAPSSVENVVEIGLDIFSLRLL